MHKLETIGQAVVFEVQDEEYGIPIEYILSIESLKPMEEIPDMPDYMEGVITIRGEFKPILNMNKLLFGEKSQVTDRSRIIILHTEELTFGLIVDNMKEIKQVPQGSIQQLEILSNHESSYLLGVANLDYQLLVCTTLSYQQMRNFIVS